jgi:hypothetical protein
MTIEATLERIAVALEKLAEGGAAVAAPSSESASDSSSQKKTDSPAPTGSSKKPSTKSQKTKATKSPDPAPSEAESFSLTDVRKALTDLQKAKSPAVAKDLLGEFGAKTLSQLAEGDYGKLINKAQELSDA